MAFQLFLIVLYKQNYHPVVIEADSHLAKILGATDVTANTAHHQAVKDLAPGFRVVAKAYDGTIEAMENEDGSIICTQWHPEGMQEMEMYREYFKAFIEKCKK